MADGTPYAKLLRTKLPAFDAGRPTFAEWVGQLHKVRGRLAHGKTAVGYKSDWSQFDHLVAAAFVYPLALKGLLAKHAPYSLTDDEVAHVLGLDGLLAARPFFELVDAPEEAAAGLDKASAAAMRIPRWQAQFEVLKGAMTVVEIRQPLKQRFAWHER